MSETISRRDFLLQSALYGGTLWAALNMPRPRALAAAAASDQPVALTELGWKTVEAMTGRIIPADAEPGAIEAHVVNFIDKALANEDKELKPVYAAGLAGVDAVSVKRFKKKFVELTPKEQDEILAALESGNPDGWPKGPVSAPAFFAAVRAHTVFGFLCDPVYGGNRDYIGWKVAGYPGRQHHRGGYTKEQMLGKEPIIPAWKA